MITMCRTTDFTHNILYDPQEKIGPIDVLTVIDIIIINTLFSLK